MNVFKLLIYIMFLMILGCDLPQDPKSTFHLMKKHGLRVGVIHSPPDINILETPFTGHEIKLLNDFAKEYSVKINFKPMGLDEGLKNLENNKIDILAGGFLKSFPYKHVGLTRPYNAPKNKIMAVVQGENLFLIHLEKFVAKHIEAQK